MVVGDCAVINLSGINPESIKSVGKAGSYSCYTNPRTGERIGAVTAIKKGTIKLYQLVGTKKKKVCVIKVEEPKLKNELNLKFGTAKRLKLKGTKQLADFWESSDLDVVKVEAGGIIRAVGRGSARVSAQLGRHTYVCIVYVK